MNDDTARLLRWLRRSQPSRADLVRALVTGLVATTTNVALLVGAVALLVESARQPGLHAVALVLVIIELFAFLRSPLRYAERLNAHRLGYAAVTRWRRWLVLAVGQLNFSRWRHYASGDLLERALGDTDELSDLWLRFVVPFVDTAAVMVLGDLVVAVLPPHGGWWTYAAILFGVQAVGVVGLFALARRELRLERDVRGARGQYRAQVVELSIATPELVLLGRERYAQVRSLRCVERLEHAEAHLQRHRRRSNVVVVLASLAALTSLVAHPRTSSVWLVVVATIALATYEALGVLRASLRAAVAVSGGGERLEALASDFRDATHAWPRDSTIEARNVTLVEEHRVLLGDASFTIEPGAHVALVGDSGVGKSTLLRVLAAIDEPHEGAFYVGGVSIATMREEEFRRHVAYVPSEPGLTRGYALDVLTLGRTGTRDAHEDLAALGLASDRTTRFEDLSRGERVRVALARALFIGPDVLLLDEVTAGLGAAETRRLLDLVATTSATVIFATHDPDVLEWCDALATLEGARLHYVTR